MHSIASCASWKSARRSSRVGRDQRQVARIGEVDQRVFGGLLDRIVAPRDLDIEPAERTAPAAGRDRLRALLCCPSASSRASAPSAPAVSAIRPSLRPSSVRTRTCGSSSSGRSRCADRDERRDCRSPVVLGIERQPVDAAFASDFGRARDGEHRADDRLHALGDAGVAERHGAIEPVAIGHARPRESRASPRVLGDRLGLDRAFEHRVGREDAKRDVGLSSRQDYGIFSAAGQGSRLTYPRLSRRLPASIHDVSDFAHPPNVSVSRCTYGSGTGRDIP